MKRLFLMKKNLSKRKRMIIIQNDFLNILKIKIYQFSKKSTNSNFNDKFKIKKIKYFIFFKIFLFKKKN